MAAALSESPWGLQTPTTAHSTTVRFTTMQQRRRSTCPASIHDSVNVATLRVCATSVKAEQFEYALKESLPLISHTCPSREGCTQRSEMEAQRLCVTSCARVPHLAEKGEASIQIHEDAYLDYIRDASDPHSSCLVPLNTKQTPYYSTTDITPQYFTVVVLPLDNGTYCDIRRERLTP